jgi:hypothetical protein
LLKTSGITKEEVLSNHQEVLNVLEFQDNYQNKTPNPSANPLPEETFVSLDELITKGDPQQIFTDEVKIGEG